MAKMVKKETRVTRVCQADMGFQEGKGSWEKLASRDTLVFLEKKVFLVPRVIEALKDYRVLKVIKERRAIGVL